MNLHFGGDDPGPLPETGRSRYDAVVVGAGPNGLSAGITLARRGLDVLLVEAADEPGGACRSAEWTRPGFVHDVGASILPLSVASPFFRTLPLERHGVEWIHPPDPLAHPLDGGRAVVLRRSIGATAGALGYDGPAYRRLMGPLASRHEELLDEILRPLLRIPQRPVTVARFGVHALQSADSLARRIFEGEEARALFGGVAAHASVPLDALGSSALGLVLCTAAHTVGWPFPRGGAGRLTDALASIFRELGGELVTGWRVGAIEELPPARAVLLDLTPRQILAIAGEHLPGRYRRRLERYRYGTAAFKIDYALGEPIPWTADACRGAGTLHLGGGLGEIAEAERAAAGGRVPDSPFVLLAQHSLFDPSRAPSGRHTAWVYCHVPHGCAEDLTGRVERQIERFAPGFRDVVLDRAVSPPAALEAMDPNLVGGDVNGGANTLRQLVGRPVLARHPYRLPIPGVYMCSSSTPPGGGVHGLCGFHAASLALRDLGVEP